VEVQGVFQRRTQTAHYWGEGFRFSEDDVAYLTELLLDRELPASTDELVDALIVHRCRKEEAELRARMAEGALYQPREDFDVGQQVIFPALDFASATVVEKRAGRNPEHGEFNVIKVRFKGRRKLREFAAALQSQHRLNLDDGGDSLIAAEGMLSPRELKESVVGDLGQRLTEHLGAVADGGFVQEGGQWLLRDMLADVNVGQLNIAEALIEVAGQPTTTERLMQELDLPSQIQPEVLRFSVDHALALDDRFDDVGVAGKNLWYLRRLEPEAALEVPEPLRYVDTAYDRSSLSGELLRLEWELGDEWSDEVGGATASAAPSVTLVLSYPHRRAGTLPLSFRNIGLFPAVEASRSMITMIDGRWGQRFVCWVVRDSRYVVGFGDWFEEHKVPVGAYVVLERGQEPDTVVVDIRPRRMRREWTRMARVDGNQLVFEMRKAPIACEYDELMVVDALDPAAVEDLGRTMERSDLSLDKLLNQVFLELLKLSPDGRVHAKTLYSAVNLVRRSPPGPVFAALLSSKRYQPMGDGFWAAA
jgi:hypothetical protein